MRDKFEEFVKFVPSSIRVRHSMTKPVPTCTTLTAMSRERGRVAMMSRMEMMVMRWAHRPGPSSHTGQVEGGVIW